LGLLYARLHDNAFSSIAGWRKHYRPDSMEMVLESTLTITQLMLLTQTSQSD